MDIETAPTTTTDADWQARVDLAAVYRLLAHHGWGDVIFNHAAMRTPSNPRHFFIKRHELLYTEVTASNLVEVSMDADLDERSGVNRPGLCKISLGTRILPMSCNRHPSPSRCKSLARCADLWRRSSMRYRSSFIPSSNDK